MSAHAFPETQGLQKTYFCLACVELDGEQLKKLPQPITLYPDMPAEAYINTGSRSFFAYLFSPITDSLNRAFKED